MRPRISLKKLDEACPDFKWAEGHSGVLLPKEIIDQIVELWDKKDKA